MLQIVTNYFQNISTVDICKEMLNSQSRWIRQEYKTNKDKFEKPFKITIEDGACENVTTTQLTLDQNYQGLGCTVWDGSIALAKMFENDLEIIENLRRFNILELGAGCGLVGLTLLHLGAKYVLLTDMEVCLPTLNENVFKNTQTSMRDRVQVMPYVWGEVTTALTKRQGKFDIIVWYQRYYTMKLTRGFLHKVLCSCLPRMVSCLCPWEEIVMVKPHLWMSWTKMDTTQLK